jgi:hypothetical protein
MLHTVRPCEVGQSIQLEAAGADRPDLGLEAEADTFEGAAAFSMANEHVQAGDYTCILRSWPSRPLAWQATEYRRGAGRRARSSRGPFNSRSQVPAGGLLTLRAMEQPQAGVQDALDRIPILGQDGHGHDEDDASQRADKTPLPFGDGHGPSCQGHPAPAVGRTLMRQRLRAVYSITGESPVTRRTSPL